MPKETKEPQSYGSNEDWVTGETGEQVNDPKAPPPPEHRDFYEEKGTRGDSEPHQGGETSPLQVAESVEPVGHAATEEEQPIARMTTREGGAKRDSFFRKRDWE